MEAERVDEGPKLMLLIRNTSGEVIRRIPAPHSKGFHRVSWDMRHPSAGALDASHPPKEMDPKGPTGFPAVPGSYTASLVLLQDGQMQWTQGPVSFELTPLRKGALEGGSMEEVDAFWRGLEAASGRNDLIAMAVSELTERVEALQVASERSHSAPGSTDSLLFVLRKEIQALRPYWSRSSCRWERRRLPWSPNVYSLWCAVWAVPPMVQLQPIWRPWHSSKKSANSLKDRSKNFFLDWTKWILRWSAQELPRSKSRGKTYKP